MDSKTREVDGGMARGALSALTGGALDTSHYETTIRDGEREYTGHGLTSEESQKNAAEKRDKAAEKRDKNA
jgi:hypothetical protein